MSTTPSSPPPLPLRETDRLIVVTRAAQRLALDRDAWVQILEAAGLIGRTSMFSVRLDRIPDGLDTAELKRYLLDNGHDIVPQSRLRA